jgi:hypothetical protein
MEHPSARYLLADTLIVGGVAAFITGRREAGVSWRRLARELYEVTDGLVDVTEATLRIWHPELTQARAS